MPIIWQMKQRWKTSILLIWRQVRAQVSPPPEEDVDGGGNIQAAADVKGDLVVPEMFFA
jgi:hypothetical protein